MTIKQSLEMGLPTVAYVLFGSSISSTWHNALCIVVDLLQVISQVCRGDLHTSERGTEGPCTCKQQLVQGRNLLESFWLGFVIELGRNHTTQLLGRLPSQLFTLAAVVRFH